MTFLYLINYYILQWFFIRLAVVQWDVESVVGNNKFTLKRFKILTGVYPLSGWDGIPYRYVNGK